MSDDRIGHDGQRAANSAESDRNARPPGCNRPCLAFFPLEEPETAVSVDSKQIRTVYTHYEVRIRRTLTAPIRSTLTLQNNLFAGKSFMSLLQKGSKTRDDSPKA